MNECIRVLQVVTIMNRGGIENMLMNLYRNIDKSKVQFDFVVHRREKGHFDDEIKSLGGRIYYAPRYTVANHLIYKKWWERFFADNKSYKLIHSHNYILAPIHLKIAKKYGLITIDHAHTTSSLKGIKGHIQDLIMKNSYKIPDHLFACSDAAGRWLYGDNCLNFDNYYVIKNAIDTNKYVFNAQVRQALRKELGLEEKFVVGHVGNFTKPKNHLFIVEVFREILSRRPDAMLVLVGDGDRRNLIIEKIKESGIEDSVLLLGIRDDVNNIMQAFDCFVFPSIFEGLPVTVIEAQAAGLKCFISDNITDEVCITNLVKRLPIDIAPKKWAEEILSENDYSRTNTETEITQAGYDINSTTEWLEEFYLKLV